MFFFNGNFFGVSHVNFLFCVSRVWKKKPFFQKKGGGGNTRTTQQPPLLPEEVKHIAPKDILGTSGTRKAMEPWREGWFLYSSPVDGGNNVEHTHHDHKQKNDICPSAFGKRYQNDYIAAGATGYEAQASDTTSGQQHCSYATIMAWGQLQEVAEHTLVDQSSLCVRCL